MMLIVDIYSNFMVAWRRFSFLQKQTSYKVRIGYTMLTFEAKRLEIRFLCEFHKTNLKIIFI